MKDVIKNIRFFCVIAAILLSTSCIQGMLPDTMGAKPSDVAGNYTVIFYGCNFLNDPETIAFLDKEGDQFMFVPYAPDFNLRVRTGVAGKEALEQAEKFINCSSSYLSKRLSRVPGPKGDTIGYELRPLYDPLQYGLQDILNIGYRLKDDKVIISIRLDSSVERMLRGNGPSAHER